MKAELQSVEPDLTVVLEEMKGEKKGKALEAVFAEEDPRALSALPHGVMKMSADIAGTGRDLDQPGDHQVGTEEDHGDHQPAQFGGVGTRRDRTHGRLDLRTGRGGSEVLRGLSRLEAEHGLPDPEDREGDLRAAVWPRAAREGVHAGLECGIIGERYPGMDMVSFGPTLECVHSPDEKIYIDTVPKFYEFLLAILKNVR